MADAGEVTGHATEAVGHAGEKAGNFFTHKLGPLPVWAWTSVAVVIGGILWYVHNQTSAASGLASALNNAGIGSPVVPGGDTSGGGGGGTTTTPTTPANTLTNAQWALQIQQNGWLQQAATTAGLSLAEAQLYLNEFLAGTAPGLSGQYETNYQSFVNSLLGLAGAPPQQVTPAPPGTNPFANNASWEQEILAFLPSGTATSIVNELTALFNGTATSISQAAADVLASAENIVGNAPSPLNYSITAPSIAPPSPPYNPLLTQATQWIQKIRQLGGSIEATNAAEAEYQWLLYQINGGYTGTFANLLSQYIPPPTMLGEKGGLTP